MKQYFILFSLLFQASYLFSQNPVPAPEKNGHYEKKEDKRIVETGDCANGFKTGLWIYYDALGKIIKQEDFTDKGFLIDTKIFSYENSLVEERITSVGQKEVEYKLYESSSKQIHTHGYFFNSDKDSAWTYYRKLNHAANLWKSEDWKAGVLLDTKTYYPTGIIFKSVEENKNGEDNTVYYDTTGSEIPLPKVSLSGDSAVHPGVSKDIEMDTSETVFTFVEMQPVFYGGMDKLNEFISSNIRYPQMEKENGIQGKVFVEFEVNKYGDVVNVKVKNPKSGNAGLEKEAIRVVEMMPPWTPGRMNGKIVRVKFALPINFKLE